MEGFRTIEIKKGRHYPSFRDCLFGIGLTLLDDVAFFTPIEASKYELDPTDQADWNKLYGRLAYKFIGGKLVRLEEWYVWRWLPELDTFQIAKYTNEGGKMKWFDEVDVKVGQEAILDNGWFSYLLPLFFHFGGSDSNGDGRGGVAPKNIKFLIR